ncbi:MAG TPA: CoA transferase subunit A [Desulfobacteraceae bacterium]|nr:CoA transferase subunit A [Desulfobacteraceae bacterium]
MKKINKWISMEEALEGIQSQQSIMVGGFGVPGTPFTLLQALAEKKLNQLTLIKNEANEAGMGISNLIEAKMVTKLITSHLGLNSTVIKMMNNNEILVDFFPQGILAEKIRAGGAGLAGILTDIGIDTILSRDKEIIMVDGKKAMVEKALRADVALVHAAKADRAGNLVYTKSARNFNPIMAMAADIVIAEAEEIVETGEIDPDQVHTPAAFVDRLVAINEITREYEVLESHVIQK